MDQDLLIKCAGYLLAIIALSVLGYYAIRHKGSVRIQLGNFSVEIGKINEKIEKVERTITNLENRVEMINRDKNIIMYNNVSNSVIREFSPRPSLYAGGDVFLPFSAHDSSEQDVSETVRHLLKISHGPTYVNSLTAASGYTESDILDTLTKDLKKEAGLMYDKSGNPIAYYKLHKKKK